MNLLPHLHSPLLFKRSRLKVSFLICVLLQTIEQKKLVITKKSESPTMVQLPLQFLQWTQMITDALTKYEIFPLSYLRQMIGIFLEFSLLIFFENFLIKGEVINRRSVDRILKALESENKAKTMNIRLRGKK